MNVFEHSTAELSPHLRREVEFDSVVRRGQRGRDVRRVQEWLTLHGFGLVVDGDFGPATQRQVTAFQERCGLEAVGDVDEETAAALVEPLVQVLRQRLNSSRPLGEAVVEYAQAHLAVHPREVGGQNRGPWVRAYMGGREGADQPWCAGFVTFVLHQAAQSLGVPAPIAGSASCDVLAAQGGGAGLFVAEADVEYKDLPTGSLFLVRSRPGDWTHTGLVVEAREDDFDTIEGNTNDDGSREGYEVCARARGYAGKDFVRLP
ncbi:putative peptidoglycan binding protein [Kineococcus xinjiangensis]|uniref:Putative peptidoglycan binding protein n=1 Tax=Kineococcus xinjiangensis TaxID=512762 RepID=A0A2S6IPG0_9ACTN|nr:peptidoglycan-binding domain-containing protein [Kineococcus xinjiangensis]PPK96144.1 putative peptidoglycan binding protein [Kineococcus xinjiangensis]